MKRDQGFKMTFHRIIRRAKRHRDLKFLSEKNLVKLSQIKNLLCLNCLPVFLLRLYFLRFRSDSKSSLFKA